MATRRLNIILQHLIHKEEPSILPERNLSIDLRGVYGSIVDSEKHGGELVAHVLKSHNIKFIFTLVGGHISPILVAAKQLGIRVIDTRHEVTAVFAADATARLSGIPGVAAVTAGPGVTNTITAIKNAQMAQSPLILIGGAAATMLKGRGALQDIDQMSVFKPIVKLAITCQSVREIVPALRKAFQEASSGVPGPVFVEFPLDVLYPIHEVMSGLGLCVRTRARDVKDADFTRVIVPVESKDKSPKDFVGGKKPDAPVFLKPSEAKGSFFLDAYSNYKIKSLFSGAWDHKDFSPLPIAIPQPSLANILQVVDILKAAKTPVLIVSSQAMLASERAQEIQDAVLAMKIPTFLGGMARGLLGRNSPYHIRQNRGVALKQADVVILAGTVCDFRLEYGRGFNKKSKIIAINRSKEDLQLNSGIFWNPTVAALADPALFLLKLLKYGKGTKAEENIWGKWDSWCQKLKSAEQKKESANQKKASDSAWGHDELEGKKLVNPLELFYKLEELLPEKSILVADGGDFVATASYILRPRGPLSWLDPGAFGTLGVGGGFALGAKLCRPDAQVWVIWGDGSAGYSIAEYDTFKRHGIPVIGLIGNDAGWTQIEREQIPMFNDRVACPLAYCAYDQVSVGYGGAGIQIKDTESIQKGIQEAQKLESSGTPVVVNVLIGKTDFREGSLSV